MDHKDKIIEDLKTKVEEEVMVKQSEVLMNKDLKLRIEQLELEIELLQKVNNYLLETTSKLRVKLKNIINE
jgi:hypothetical protein